MINPPAESEFSPENMACELLAFILHSFMVRVPPVFRLIVLEIPDLVIIQLSISLGVEELILTTDPTALSKLQLEAVPDDVPPHK